MGLPKINDVPLYTAIVPSSGKQVNFRPFLVKEQKILLIAFESQDEGQIINAMINTINSCCEGIDASTLAKIDVDYLFAMIRAKSVGENVKLNSQCSKCQEQVTFEFNINELKMPEMKHRSRVVDLSPEIKVKVRVPSYSDILANRSYEENISTQETLSRLIISCIESVQTQEENIIMKDETYEDKVNFIEFLTIDQFSKLGDFIGEIPTISYDLEQTCEKCGSKEKRHVEGIDNFF